METFIQSHCRALEIPAVLDQALELKSMWDAARHEDAILPYSRVRDRNSHPELYHAHFPDLYYAAIAFAKANKIVGDNFQISQSHPSNQAALIDKHIIF